MPPKEEVKVKVIKKERKLKVFDGTEGAKGFRIWKEEALAAIESLGYTGTDAGKHLYDYLSSDCKQEIKLAQGEAVKNSADELLKALASIYGDKRTLAQRRSAFYNCKQRGNENILEFSHRLLAELEAVAELDKEVKNVVRTTMLKDQFAENVADRHLRWELRKKKEEATEFKDLRQVALDWSEQLGEEVESDTDSSRKSKSRSARAEAQGPVSSDSSFSPELENRFQKIEVKLDQHASALSTMLQQQQELINQLKEIKLGSGRQSGGGRSCYNCGEPGHFRRDCPARKRQGNGSTPENPAGAQSGGRS